MSSSSLESCDGFVDGTPREHYGISKAQFCDSRDGKKYVYVTIGEQVWMAENLNYEVENSFCLDDDPANCDKYGRQYSWAIAMALPISCNNSSCSSSISARHKGICPSGWHIPGYMEWDKLMRYVDPSIGSYGTTAAKYLKATSGWESDGGNGIDNYGFSALNVPKTGASYWRTNEYNNTCAYGQIRYYGSEKASLWYDYKRYLWSVRCLQD